MLIDLLHNQMLQLKSAEFCKWQVLSLHTVLMSSGGPHATRVPAFCAIWHTESLTPNTGSKGEKRMQWTEISVWCSPIFSAFEGKVWQSREMSWIKKIFKKNAPHPHKNESKTFPQLNTKAQLPSKTSLSSQWLVVQTHWREIPSCEWDTHIWQLHMLGDTS